jgi:shikimate kinase
LSEKGDFEAPAILPISLVGMPGSGKSTIGRLLAQRLGMKLFDTDACIEEETGLKVQQLFAEHGEAHFRKIEAEIIRKLLSKSGSVIATGGGSVLNPQTFSLLRTNSRCVYLKATVEHLYARLRNDRKRPLLQVADPFAALASLHIARNPIYEELAHITVETGSLSAKALVEHICASLES